MGYRSLGGAVTTHKTLPDLLGEFRIYPVEIAFPRRSGVTLWGGNVDGDMDFFLTGKSGKVLLAHSLTELEQRVPTEGEGSLSQVAGFRTIASALSTGEKLTEDDDTIDRIDYKSAAAVLAREGDLAAETVGEIVTCLDAARDLALQTGDSDVLGRLQNIDAPLGNLYRFLCGEADNVDRNPAAAAFDEMVDWFLTHVE